MERMRRLKLSIAAGGSNRHYWFRFRSFDFSDRNLSERLSCNETGAGVIFDGGDLHVKRPGCVIEFRGCNAGATVRMSLGRDRIAFLNLEGNVCAVDR